jgi:hypothetical protein
MDNCFLNQCVVEPTFQDVNGKLTNVLDLLIVDDVERFINVTHNDSMGTTRQGHHLLKWNYIVNEDIKKKFVKKSYCFKRGEFDGITQYFEDINIYLPTNQ